MAFQLSPGVLVVEKDFSAIVPAVSTSVGAFAGLFQWGPVLFPTSVYSENVLVQQFGRPTNETFQDFFTAANFLGYTNNLILTRIDTVDSKNAVSTGTAIKIKNALDYITNFEDGAAAVGPFAAKFPGSMGNSLKVCMADIATFSEWETTLTNGVTIDLAAQFPGAPGTSDYAVSKGELVANDEMHIIVIDEDGAFTGTAGSILEKFAYVSKASDAKKFDGTNNYYKNVINNQSKYIWWTDHTTDVSEVGANLGAAATTLAGTSYKTLEDSINVSLVNGADDFAPDNGDYIDGFRLFADAETYDISLILTGNAPTTVAIDVINNVAEARLDCVAFISANDDGAPIIGNTSSEIDAINAYRNALPSTSYAVMDSGVKYQYDRYNDVYRWVPLNGDIGGLCARTDYTTEAWFSPGGMNRGQIKNCIKLGVSPNKPQRDDLYKNGVNPVVTFPGEGTVLFGDKTLLAKPSAFDRINVRRLFIVLEKAIAIAAKFQLFEFNDGFTRAQFKNIVEPFLRDVQGRRGVTDFKVVCDETNNTAEVIDSNSFVADIYIKPNRSINFITLNFIAARSGVNFEELGA